MDGLLHRLPPRRFADAARLILDEPTSAWIDSGIRHEGELSADLRAFLRWRITPRVLVDVGDVSLDVELMGTPSGLPVVVAPLGLQRALHPDGETGLARGASAHGAITIVSANTSTPIEAIAEGAPDATLWFQLAPWTDRDSIAALVDRLTAAGVRALVPLVNGPVAAAHVPASAGFRLPPGVAPVHAPAQGGMDPRATAEYLAWLASITDLPIVPKGIMHPDDARRAVDAGARGVIVSNHGCRQLQRAVGTLDALPGVVDAVGETADVYLDGGVRTGSDVLVALALGARAVVVGRLMAWALAVGGADGVERALGALSGELSEAAALSGVVRVRETPRDLVMAQ